MPRTLGRPCKILAKPSIVLRRILKDPTPRTLHNLIKNPARFTKNLGRSCQENCKILSRTRQDPAMIRMQDLASQKPCQILPKTLQNLANSWQDLVHQEPCTFRTSQDSAIFYQELPCKILPRALQNLTKNPARYYQELCKIVPRTLQDFVN